MRRLSKNQKEENKTPLRVSEFLDSHQINQLTQDGVSHNLLFPLADYIEQKQSSVLSVAWGEISKSVQRVTTSRHSG